MQEKFVQEKLGRDDILAQQKTSSQHMDCYLSGGRFVNKSWFVKVFGLPTNHIDKEIALALLKGYAGSIWDAGGELAGWDITSQETVETLIDLSKGS